MLGAGYPHVEDIGCRHDGPRLAAGPYRRAVGHAVHNVFLDHLHPGAVAPCPPPVTVDAVDGDGGAGKPVDADPLLDDLDAVDGVDRPVLRTVPDGNARPVPSIR